VVEVRSHAGTLRPVNLVLGDWVDAERDRIVATLCDWLRIPSISAHPERAADVRRSAQFAAGLLRDAGLERVEVLETAAGGGLPSVYGEHLGAGPGAPTVLVYGHHDVQPVDPLEEWTSPPFEPVLAGGELRGRGAIDDKGQTMFQVEAVRGLLAAGHLPVNVKFLLEGEEEVGSPNFEALLEAERERLACDVVVVSDTDMWAPEVPSVCVGMRGLIAYGVSLRTAPVDLHSGLFGGAVPNPAHLIARMVAALHDAEGRVAVPGFYDDVRPLTEAEEASLREIPVDEAAWMEMAGVRRLEGEAGRSLLERIWTRPTCDVVGIAVGYAGAGVKTIVPAHGRFTATFRLVPDQSPDVVGAAFEAWVGEQVPEGVDVEVTRMGGVAPALTPVDHPAMTALCQAVERVWGKAPLFTRIGGSGPEEALGRILAAPVLYLGVALPDDRFHAPNERMVMDQFWKGLLAAGELYGELGRRG
jgi:acetylornithine deacetylase/succinyl-diaminopimelate desuccinylase-like protein